nr:adhesion G-protein coupled receptor G1-like isoform X2 [Hydra vulgaris]
MAVEGLNLYRCFVKVFGSSSNSQTFLLKSSAFAWGIPLILTVATAASKSNYLGPEFKDESQILGWTCHTCYLYVARICIDNNIRLKCFWLHPHTWYNRWT